MPGVDRGTKYQGVYARHRESCAITENRRCNCSPAYYGAVWDQDAGKYRRTGRFRLAVEARNARNDLMADIGEGRVSFGSSLRFKDARPKFIEAAREGIALNKWGRRYRRRAVENLESALNQIPDDIAKKRLSDIRRGDIQRVVDELNAKGRSGSRIRSVVHAVRSLYSWAQDHELADHDPSARVRLPAMNAKPRDRVATPAEFAQLLDALTLADALPFALAGYATARHQEIRVLDWTHVDFKLDAVELAGDEEGRKPGGSWRIVPLVSPLRTMLRRAWIEQGRPTKGKVCPPRNKGSRSKLLALSHLQERVHKIWRDKGLNPIGLHEARHTAATWLDHSGVSPKVSSQLMGHKTPEYQAGAAPITLQRYTHTLPGELERARDLLDAFIAERVKAPAAKG